MDGWTPIEKWHECARMERPQTHVEVRNADGMTLFTTCGTGLPDKPFDWRTGPVEFRIVAAPRPRRSDPIPAPSPR